MKFGANISARSKVLYFNLYRFYFTFIARLSANYLPMLPTRKNKRKKNFFHVIKLLSTYPGKFTLAYLSNIIRAISFIIRSFVFLKLKWFKYLLNERSTLMVAFTASNRRLVTCTLNWKNFALNTIHRPIWARLTKSS